MNDYCGKKDAHDPHQWSELLLDFEPPILWECRGAPNWSCTSLEDHEPHGHRMNHPDDAFETPHWCPGQPFWCGRCGAPILYAGRFGWYKYIDDSTSGWLCGFEDERYRNNLRLKHEPVGTPSDEEIAEAVESILSRPKEATS